MSEVNIKQKAISCVVAEISKANSHKEVSNVLQRVLYASIQASELLQSYENTHVSMAISFLFIVDYTKAIALTEGKDFAAFKSAYIKQLDETANQFS